MKFADLSNRVRRAGLIALLWGVFIIHTPLASLAGGRVTLTWNPSAGTNIIAEYEIHFGVASGTYSDSVSAGTNTTLTISNLVGGTMYFFAALAIDTYGLKSDFSSEASALIPLSGSNQPPTLDPVINLVFNENAGPQVVNLSGITSGATDEVQTLTVTASSSNTGLIPTPAVNYTSPDKTGTITLNPVAYANGQASITVTVNDGSTNNNMFSRVFTASVLPVNQPPTLDALANVTVSEGAGLQSVSLSGIGSGALNEADTLSVIASSSNPSLIPNPTVNYTSPNASGSISFTPVATANGSATITVTVNDDGVSNNIVSRTFTVTVAPVNQQPTLDRPADVTIDEDAPLQTIALSGITSGAANETQTLSITAVSDDTSIIPNPTIHYTSPNPTGSLTFRPVLLANGSANITVTVNDGGASNNLVARTFTVNVTPVNQAPTLDPLSDLALNESAGLQTVNLTGISAGAPNEYQTLVVTATSSDPSLIPTPKVTYTTPNHTGSIAFTPVALASGSATITVTVNDSAASNNVVSRSFTVTVNSVNQPPTLNALTSVTIDENAGPQTIALSGISAGATNENQTLTVIASSSNAGLIPAPTVAYISPSATGSITFAPVTNAYGSATITITVNDGGASFNTFSRTFTVTVTHVPSRPAVCTYALNLSPTAFSANAASGAFVIGTGSSCTWTIDAPEWVLLSATQGSGAYTGTLVVEPNTGAARLGTVTVNGNGTNVSCTITQEAPVPGAVALAMPLDNATLQSARPQFSWTLSEPVAAKYLVSIDRDGSRYLEQWVEGATNWTASADLPTGNYTWAVQACDAAGIGSWSTNSSFAVQATAPGNIVPLSPSGVVAVSGTQRLTWRADRAATSYEVYIERNGALFVNRWFTLTESVVDPTTGTFAVDVPGMGAGTYLWWVRGSSPAGTGPWSDRLKVFLYRAP
ncbi:MAG TPA: Ig-like domain-containing protein [Candidatus Paceibacterota bacterium]|nr:Ig-like domain-containing protein [Verrucomicrobiota bacterium]HSA09685.1 Ig-like domain-containing protein [Candidatus Paceibacterota bacterium]